jgi:hypothetical protein
MGITEQLLRVIDFVNSNSSLFSIHRAMSDFIIPRQSCCRRTKLVVTYHEPFFSRLSLSTFLLNIHLLILESTPTWTSSIISPHLSLPTRR